MIAARSSSVRTSSRTRCAGWPAGTKSWTDGGNSPDLVHVPGSKCFSHSAEKPHRVRVVQSNVAHYSDRLLGHKDPASMPIPAIANPTSCGGQTSVG